MAQYNSEKMKALATKYQQNYYELLPDWFQYDPTEYEYIKQNIGFGLFGPPQVDKNREVNINQNAEIFTRVTYNKKSCEVINAIYQKIIKYGRENNNSSIYVGIIYNVMFHPPLKTKSNANNDESTEKFNEMCTVPIFKIRKDINVVWYIDNNARIYKSWEDYLRNNMLPKCIMVVPKSGVYQCDPSYPITEQSSTVWIEMLCSPACSRKNTVCKVFDTASNIFSLGAAIGVGVTSFFTPVGPMLATAGLITCGVSGIWTVARSSQKLIDRGMHKECISPLDTNAFPAWLGITSTVLSLGVNGGTMLLSRAVASGRHISAVANVAYDSLIVSNLTVTGIGIAYQGYCLIDKYKQKREVEIFDIIIFTSHVLFFTNTVVNTRVASELIESSNGTILERFKNTTRFKRLEEMFNRVKGNESVKNKFTDTICRVKKVSDKRDFLSPFKNLQMTIEDGKIMVNGRTLLDPVVVTGHLLTVGAIGLNLIESDSLSAYEDTMITLTNLLSKLLKNFYSKKQSDSNEELCNVNYFNDMLSEMKGITNAADILTKIFKIGVTIIQPCNESEKFLRDAIYFVWDYSKANLKEYSINACSTFKSNKFLYNTLIDIVTYIFDVIDVISYELYSAFYAYMLNTEPLKYVA